MFNKFWRKTKKNRIPAWPWLKFQLMRSVHENSIHSLIQFSYGVVFFVRRKLSVSDNEKREIRNNAQSFEWLQFSMTISYSVLHMRIATTTKCTETKSTAPSDAARPISPMKCLPLIPVPIHHHLSPLLLARANTFSRSPSRSARTCPRIYLCYR